MNPAAAAALARRGNAIRANLFPCRVIFRDQVFTITKPSGDPSLSLSNTGPQRIAGTYRLKLPGSIQPPPAIKEKITEVETGLVYHITSCIPAPTGSDSAIQEHIIEASA